MRIQYLNKEYDIIDPNVCPHCHFTNTPHQLFGTFSKDTDDIPVFISAWSCSNQLCQKIFVAQHRKTSEEFKFVRFLNGLPKGPIFPKPIQDLKSGNPIQKNTIETTRFIKTYLQSLVAENNELNELAGMGYRKAIEYLVKDWAIQNNPNDKEKVEGLWLGQVISKYYEGDLKEILERATWLGNDQAHYNRLFEEFEINVLKELIELIMVELDRQYKKKHYIDTIQSRK